MGIGGVLLVGPLALNHHTILPGELKIGSGEVKLAMLMGRPGNATNPTANNSRAAQSGQIAYLGSCAVCHGGNGKGSGALSVALFPPASDLTAEDAVEKSDAQLYWVISNGLSFAGMPSFKDQYSSNDIWAMVTYIRTLQKPTTTATTDPNAAAARGLGVWIGEGCQNCHGTPGAGGPVGIGGGGGEGSQAIRRGRPGMPAYSTQQLTDAELSDLEAYMSNPSAVRIGRGGEGDR